MTVFSSEGVRYYHLAAASFRDNLPYSWCYRVDIGTSVSLDRSAYVSYVFGSGELLGLAWAAFAGSMVSAIMVVYEGMEIPRIDMPLFHAILRTLYLEVGDMVALQRITRLYVGFYITVWRSSGKHPLAWWRTKKYASKMWECCSDKAGDH